MYQCPGCGGELHFDIASQQIKCTYCNTLYNPYQFQDKVKDAEMQNYFETTIHTCPQCGGEVYTVENESASFCSFCGASTILSSRLNKEERPTFILPFKKTKQDCIEAYEKRMKKAIFAPKELRDPKYLSSFRGIYMPYWTFQIQQQGSVAVDSTKSHRSGDYIITKHFTLSADIEASYAGFSFDASSSFYDSISENLAPFDTRQLVEFDPTFLLGFYADTADVPYDLYEQQAVDLAAEQTSIAFQTAPEFNGYPIDSGDKKKIKNIPYRCNRTDRTLFPVWFLTYQKNNRVAYVTVNGQTGKIVADIPVDSKKYILFSLLLTLPIFAFLEMFPTMSSVSMAAISGLLALFTSILYHRELKEIYRKDHNLDDLGLQHKHEEKFANTQKKKKLSEDVKPLIGVLIFIALCGCFPAFIFAFIGLGDYALAKLIIFICAIGTLIFAIINTLKNRTVDDSHLSIGVLLGCVFTIIAAIIVITEVVSDLFYYGIALLIAVSVVITILEIIRNYNVLSTRKLPQYNKKGGNHNAY